MEETTIPYSFLEATSANLAMYRELRRKGTPEETVIKAMIATIALQAKDVPITDLVEMLRKACTAARTKEPIYQA